MYLFHFIFNKRNCLKSKCSLVDKRTYVVTNVVLFYYTNVDNAKPVTQTENLTEPNKIGPTKRLLFILAKQNGEI